MVLSGQSIVKIPPTVDVRVVGSVAAARPEVVDISFPPKGAAPVQYVVPPGKQFRPQYVIRRPNGGGGPAYVLLRIDGKPAGGDTSGLMGDVTEGDVLGMMGHYSAFGLKETGEASLFPDEVAQEGQVVELERYSDSATVNADIILRGYLEDMR